MGLDAACWEYLNPLLENGRLPTIKRLMETGSTGVLESTVPAVTPVAWASIVTGKNPGKHGVFGFMERVPGTYNFVPTNAQARRGIPFWKRLNERGIRVGLVNVPYTYPPDAIDGFVVSGFGAPNNASNITYPADLVDWIRREIGHYEPEVDIELIEKTAPPSKIFEIERGHQKRQIQIALKLSERFRVDVLVINLMLFDHSNHFMPEMEQVYEALGECDRDIATLIDGFVPDAVLLISDHGSRRFKGSFLVHNWLGSHGYVKHQERTSSDREGALNWVLVHWFKTHRWSGPLETILRRLARAMLTKMPCRWTQWVWKLIERSIPIAREYVSFTDQIDYRSTQVLPDFGADGLFYFNILGRDPRGVVTSQTAGELMTKLKRELQKIVDPDTNLPLVSRVNTAHELYAGPAIGDAPDVIVDDYKSVWSWSREYRQKLFDPGRNGYFIRGTDRRFGGHSRDGILVFSGDGFVKSEFARGHVMDVPATLLYLHGVPIPEDYDGRVLSAVFAPEFVLANPVTFQSGDTDSPSLVEIPYTREQEEELIQRLKALGYLE